MKKLFAAAAAFMMCAALAACGGGGDDAEPTASPTATPDGVISSSEAVSKEVFETPVENDRILGSWVNEENSVSIVFNDDGTYVNDSIEGDYTLDGNTLTLSYYGGEVVEDYSVGFSGDRLVLVRDDLQLIFEKTE